MKLPFHSLRWRIQAWHGVILLLAVTAFCFTAYRLAWDTQLRRVDAQLNEGGKQFVRALFQEINNADGTGERLPPDVVLLKIARENRLKIPSAFENAYAETTPGFRWFGFFDPAGTVIFRSPNAPADFVLPQNFSADGADEIIRTSGHRRESIHKWRGGIVFAYGCDLEPVFDEMRRYAWSLAGCGLGVWVLGLLGGWWMAGRAIRPIKKISDTAARIAGGSLAERIDTDGTENELDQLGRVLNQTFDRLHAAFERQRQFTADASHELRTPIAILLSETQRTLKRERTVEEYREVIQTCGETAERMRHLVQALLLLARQERTTGGEAFHACDLAEVVRDVMTRTAPLARERGITVHTDLQSAICRGDAAALTILATNLVTNAIAHHRSEGDRHVYLNTRSDATRVTLTVRDDGPGIPPESLPHIFERFYRVDTARTGGVSNHAGLGLAIVRSIAENHGGTVSVQSTPDEGTSFTVVLPT